MSDTHGTIHWSELVTTDPAGAVAFFRDVAGWEVSEMPMPEGPYYICKAQDRMVAGIMGLDAGKQPDVPPHWMTYIAVDNVEAACASTAGGGGTVLRPPFEVPGVGHIATVKDPQGAVVGLITPAAAG